MYTPEKFREQDRAEIVRVMMEHPFATIISTGADGVIANHLPVLFDAGGPNGTLIGHMALANPQWRSFENSAVLAIFHGPHCYVSPSLYVTKVNVPTWNYVAVHAHGRAELVDRDALHEIVARTVETFEAWSPNPWKLDVPEDYKNGLLPHIVGFRIPIERIEAKFKLNQNRPDVDRRAVISALAERNDSTSREMHGIMQRLDHR